MKALSVDEVIKDANFYLVAKNQYNEFIYCNEPFAELLDLTSPQNILGKTDFNFFPEYFAKFYMHTDEQVMQGKKVINQKEVLHRTNGCQFHTTVSKNILMNKNNEIDGVVISFIVTDTQTPQTSQLHFRRQYSRYYFPFTSKEYFTQREYEVFCAFIDRCYSAKEIAKRLGDISQRTIETHLTSIQRKLQCTSKLGIIPAAMSLGLLH